MICAVHASVGAALGKLIPNRWAAFGAGVLSHWACDLLPHKDFDPRTEAVLLAASLAALAAAKGVKSPEFAGACGAVAPDLENAAQVAGVIKPEQMVFPSHQGDHAHGRKTESAWPQGVLVLACLAFVFWPRKK